MKMSCMGVIYMSAQRIRKEINRHRNVAGVGRSRDASERNVVPFLLILLRL